MGDLRNVLGNALMRVAREIYHGDVDARGLLRNPKPMAAVDVYMHPETAIRLMRDLHPMDIDPRSLNRKTGPPGAVAKFMNIWLIGDDQQPKDAFVIRNKGEIYDVIPLPPMERHDAE